jgi:hypothetical protein
MPYAAAEKIVTEIANPAFIERYQVSQMHVGENGDCFINKDAVDIMRLIRRSAPSFAIGCITNFQNFTDDKIEAVVKEGLVNMIACNVDGSNLESFRAVKRIDNSSVYRGLNTLVRLRREYNRPIRIFVGVLTFNHYVKAVMQEFGRLPAKLSNLSLLTLQDDYQEIFSSVAPLLSSGDGISRSAPTFWAERNLVDTSTIDYTKYGCPILGRIASEAWIAPDGTWYGCCWDSSNRLNMGNVLTTSVAEVAESDCRAKFIQQLKERRFSEIGSPCDTVNCCQSGLPSP